MGSTPSAEPDWARGSSLSTSSSQFGVPAPRSDGAEEDYTPISRAGPLFASTRTCGCRPGVLFTPPRWLCPVCEGMGATPHTPPSPADQGIAGSWWVGDLLWKTDVNFGASNKIKKMSSKADFTSTRQTL